MALVTRGNNMRLLRGGKVRALIMPGRPRDVNDTDSLEAAVRSLFAAGEQGAWYDPSDFSTMFQDSAGTTPVTAIEQPVGLILDKSGRGNHAFQPTTTSRPILRNCINLLTYTEQFNNAVWAGGTGVTKTVNSITDTTTNSSHGIYYTLTVAANTAYTISFRVTKGTRQYIAIGFWTSAILNCGAGFDLDAGTVTGTGAIGTGYSATNASIANNGDGSYTCTVTCTQPATTNYPALLHRATAYTSGSILETYVGSITNTTTIHTASTVLANESHLPYQWVTTGGAAGYDTDVTKFPPYLFFDGSDDWLSTANINFSATDKMSVFAGVRKLSDATNRIIFETSANWGNNPGAFSMQISASVPNEYTVTSNATYTNAGTRTGYSLTSYTSPITNVAVANMDMSKAARIDVIKPRIDGIIPTLTGILDATITPANYGNYPLYIGARYGTTTRSLFFFGRIYSLIVRGALTSSPQLEQIEAYLASKTGVTL